MTRKRTESPWKAEVMLAIGARPDIVIWNQTIGVFARIGEPQSKIKVGTPGWPDIMGFQLRRYEVTVTKNPNGFTPVDIIENRFYAQAFGIETKSATGEQREAQIQAEKIFRAHYAIYILSKPDDWAAIYGVLGEEPDEECADEADRLRRELLGGASAEQQPGPVSGAGRQKGRRA